MEGKTRFIIQVNETYYVTTGPLLVYDPERSEKQEHRDGYVEVATRFKKIREEGDAVFKAVRLIDDGFSVVNACEE